MNKIGCSLTRTPTQHSRVILKPQHLHVLVSRVGWKLVGEKNIQITRSFVSYTRMIDANESVTLHSQRRTMPLSKSSMSMGDLAVMTEKYRMEIEI